MMKTEELLILALAGVASWLIVKSSKVGAGGSAFQMPAFVNEIFGTGGKQFDNGWRYFDNGVAIDPQGAYYQNGVKVWSPGL